MDEIDKLLLQAAWLKCLEEVLANRYTSKITRFWLPRPMIMAYDYTHFAMDPASYDYVEFAITKKDCGKYGWLDAVICRWPGVKEPIIVELLA